MADWLVRRRGYRGTFYCHTLEPRENWPASVGQGLDVQVFGLGGIAREPAVTLVANPRAQPLLFLRLLGGPRKKRPRPIDLVVGRSTGLGSSLFAPVYCARGAGGQLPGLLLPRPPPRPGRRGRPRNGPGLFPLAAVDGRDRPARPGAGRPGLDAHVLAARALSRRIPRCVPGLARRHRHPPVRPLGLACRGAPGRGRSPAG